MIFNLPNIISLSRVIIAPVFIWLMLSNDNGMIILGCFIYLLAAISDYIDGWYARTFGMMTKWGQFIDPLADKFLTGAALIVLVAYEIIPLWMTAVIIFRDFGTTVLRIAAFSSKENMSTSYPAKVKTALQMIFTGTILVLIFVKSTELFDISAEVIDGILYSDWVYFIMFLITILTIWTLFDYFFRNKSLLRQIWSRITKKKLANE